MNNTLFFGNGLNRISENSVSWDSLLRDLKGDRDFRSGMLPYTMIYEQIFIDGCALSSKRVDELQVKCRIADALKTQKSNAIFDQLVSMNFDNYLTTNYDYAIEQSMGILPEKKSTEDIYSLRRKREYSTSCGIKTLWNVHGEIDSPKSIMLGLDHYCGSVGKIGSYIKGTYEHVVNGKSSLIDSMEVKLKSGKYCNTSWVDLFFSSNVHVVGFSLDFSEIDIWWLLNRRARFAAESKVMNKIFFYTASDDAEKSALLKSFGVEVVLISLDGSDYGSMYQQAVDAIKTSLNKS